MFVSKQLEKDSLFRSLLIPKSFHVFGQSLITFRAASKQTIPPAQWIFFSSKNAVRFFFENAYSLENRKVACIGEGTYKVLKKYCKNIHFVGDEINIEKVAQEFQKLVENQTCLFPISNISKFTVQRYFKDQSKVFNLVVYETAEKTDFDLPFFDVLIFTSPSNARAYYQKYPVRKNQKVIAIGPSTAEQLRQLGVSSIYQSKQPGEIGLIDVLQRIT